MQIVRTEIVEREPTTAENLKLAADGYAETTARAVKSGGNHSKGRRKLWSGAKRRQRFVWSTDLTDEELAAYEAWENAGMVGKCPDFGSKWTQAPAKSAYKTGNQLSRDGKTMIDRLVNTYQSNDKTVRFLTLNFTGRYTTSRAKVAMKRAQKWIEKLADQGLPLVSGDVIVEKAADGTCHVHAVVKVSAAKLFELSSIGVDDRLLGAWTWCSNDDKTAKRVFDVRGLAKYLAEPLSMPGANSNEAAPDDMALAMAIKDESAAKSSLDLAKQKQRLAATPKAQKEVDQAQRERRRAHRAKKSELAKDFKRDDQRLLSVGVHGKAVVGKATPQAMAWLKKYADYLFTTRTEILEVSESTGEILRTLQVITKDRYRLKERAPAAELVALLTT